MIRRIIFMLIVVVGVFLAWRWYDARRNTGSISTEGKQTLKVVNVLSKELYDDAHILGSIHVDFADVKRQANGWDKTDTIVFYCANYQCQASLEAARQLKNLGFTRAMAYEGGTEEWYRLNKQGNADYKIAGPAQQGYLSIKIDKPSHSPSDITIVSAEELKKMMQEANLL